MAERPDLTAEVAARLRTRRFGRPLFVHDSVTSTNDVAKALAASGAEEGAVVLALEQTRGRGRLGRVWASPRGGVYLSVVVRPTFPPERWPLIGLACAVGAAAAAEAHLGTGVHSTARVRVKWPNDLLVSEGKFGGVLVEASGDSTVCGIGLNVTLPPDRPDSTRSGPSSIDRHESPNSGGTQPAGAPSRGRHVAGLPPGAVWLQQWNPDVTPLGVVADLLFECERRYAALAADPELILGEWRARTVTLGRMVRVEAEEPYEGVAENIDAGGALMVRTPLGLRRVHAGDVSAVISPEATGRPQATSTRPGEVIDPPNGSG